MKSRNRRSVPGTYSARRLLQVEPPDSQTIPVLIQAVRAGLEEEESYSAFRSSNSTHALYDIANTTGTIVYLAAVFEPEPNGITLAGARRCSDPIGSRPSWS
jgi:hypothetical protein